MTPTRMTILAALLLLGACSSEQAPPDLAELTPCSADWYTAVDRILGVGDEAGHGPDPGSAEWRSAVNFRLGASDTQAMAALSDAQWCDVVHHAVEAYAAKAAPARD